MAVRKKGRIASAGNLCKTIHEGGKIDSGHLKRPLKSTDRAMLRSHVSYLKAERERGGPLSAGGEKNNLLFAF